MIQTAMESQRDKAFQPNKHRAPMSPTPQPSDPYHSFVVKASAGSGKTFQLAQRYVKLVAAGADPKRILTLTFTNKAAAEMKTRVLLRARQLLDGGEEAQLFDQQMHQHHQEARQLYPVAKPLSGTVVARRILTARNDLTIMTIDALFHRWKESYGVVDSEVYPLFSESSELVSGKELGKLKLMAWQSFFDWPWKQLASSHPRFDSRPSQALEKLTRGNWDLMKKVKSLAFSLSKMRLKIHRHHHQFGGDFHPFSYLMVCHQHCLASLSSLLKVRGLPPGDLRETSQIKAALLRLLTADLTCLIKAAHKQERFASVLAAASSHVELRAFVKVCQTARLLTAKGTVSKQGISESLREKYDLGEMVSRVEKTITTSCDALLFADLSSSYQDLYEVFVALDQRAQQWKTQSQIFSYDDNTLFSHRLLCQNSAEQAEARFRLLSGIQHFLVDELQDTSLTQWDIFEQIATELLSEPSPPRTVFMVGDPKQCLYSFREASPYVMSLAEQLITKMGHLAVDLPLSYRSTEAICQYVGRVFSQLRLEDFIAPKSALQVEASANNLTAIMALCSPDGEAKVADLVKAEATVVAAQLASVLSHPHLYPVYDSQASGGLRPIRGKDVVVLYRAATHVSIWEQALRDQQIETVCYKKEGFFDRPEIKDCLHLLKFCVYPSDLLSLMAVAKSPMVGLGDDQMMAFFESISHDHLFSGELFMKWHQYFSDSRKLQAIGNFIVGSRGSCFSQDFCALMVELDCPQRYRQMYRSAGLEVEADLVGSHIERFMDMVASLPPVFATSGAEVLEWVLAQEGAASDHGDAVTLMTIHKSKGLEFPMVCLSQTGSTWSVENPHKDEFFCYAPSLKENAKENFQERAAAGSTAVNSDFSRFDKGGVPSYIVPKKPIFDDRQLFAQRPLPLNRWQEQNAAGQQKEATRLLYVALTRASQYLILSGGKSQKDSDKGVTTIFDVLRSSLVAQGSEVGSEMVVKQKDNGEGCLELMTRDLAEHRGVSGGSPSATTPYEDTYESQKSQKSQKEADIEGSGGSAEFLSLHGRLAFGEDYGIACGIDGKVRGAFFSPFSSHDKEAAQSPLARQRPLKQRRWARTKKGGEWRLFRGHYIHKTLEISLRDRKWQELPAALMPAGVMVPQDPSVVAKATEEARRCYEALTERLTGCKNLLTEVMLCGKDEGEGRLMQGKADLVAEFDDYVEIIDYKTVAQLELTPEIRSQLLMYKACLAPEFPSMPIRCTVLFTREALWVPVVDVDNEDEDKGDGDGKEPVDKPSEEIP